ncbi:hypothetical protein BaRGS_00002533 [Batillaria attramentaria]|uniref:Uncharacterized protein n=1 Tax=Batillaria attramentaria TaxID=370345 RepID=A0ABD0M4G7_9CAEN
MLHIDVFETYTITRCVTDAHTHYQEVDLNVDHKLETVYRLRPVGVSPETDNFKGERCVQEAGYHPATESPLGIAEHAER